MLIEFKENKILRALIFFLIILLSLYFLSSIISILVIIFLAFIISSGLKPVVEWLEKKKIKRALAIAIVYMVMVFILSLIIFLIFREGFIQIKLFINNFDNPQEISTFIKKALPFLEPDSIDFFVKNSVVNLFDGLKNITNGNSYAMLSQTLAPLGVRGINILGNVLNLLTSGLILIMLSIYMTASKENIFIRMLNFFKLGNKKETSLVISKIEKNIGNWLIGQFILMLIIGFSSYIIIYIPRFIDPSYQLYKYALILGIIAGLFEGIPNIGPLITSILVGLIALISGAGIPVVIYILVGFFLLQQIEAVVLVPAVFKKAIDLTPIISIIAVLIGLELAGPLGALLSAPIASSINIVLKYIVEKRNIIQTDSEIK